MKEIKVRKFFEKEDGTKIPFEEVSKDERERIADQRLSDNQSVVRSLTRSLISLKEKTYDDAS